MFNIHLPEGWKVREGILSKELKSEFGEVTWNWYESGNQFMIRNEIKLIGLDILPEQYSHFKLFLNDIEKQDLKMIKLVKKE